MKMRLSILKDQGVQAFTLLEMEVVNVRDYISYSCA